MSQTATPALYQRILESLGFYLFMKRLYPELIKIDSFNQHACEAERKHSQLTMLALVNDSTNA